ncbi:MAG: nucleotidyltransferase domain-containing protein [Candidatus Woesearchaeota archaeon]|jgi:predicted nucleotidyltransferase|nr:nucleotidyltransferase domain-containing protein [Candidatus Woesearchaeota archaeon]
MISNLFNQNCIKVLFLFNLSPGSKFNRKEIQERTKLNNVPLDSSLLILINSKILIREKNFYSLNFESSYLKKIMDLISKEYIGLKKIPLNVFYMVLDTVDFFTTYKNIELYLFGSYSKLTYKLNSDLDIALLSEKEDNRKEISNLIQKLHKLYGIELEIHYFDKRTFYKNKKDPIIASILREGVKLI